MSLINPYEHPSHLISPVGGLTPAQKAQLEQGAVAGAPGTNSGTGSGSGPSTVIVQRKEPLCPWFTCCY